MGGAGGKSTAAQIWARAYSVAPAAAAAGSLTPRTTWRARALVPKGQVVHAWGWALVLKRRLQQWVMFVLLGLSLTDGAVKGRATSQGFFLTQRHMRL
eukprot:CAMPEP_0179921072 /NCGR_PEP_ID=MMETSP0983-20121128/4876_1 /TAXON_ID=483367 /ORGANISM="non described non described, Strain CCMP 2436" /LENGTH=97 /DNA_ID=CAMNT_0021824259 /DNA_START=56 /DNA_END=346 /DNA_ORIENTATION=-